MYRKYDVYKNGRVVGTVWAINLALAQTKASRLYGRIAYVQERLAA